MNEAELQRNGALSDYAVADLNANPVLPYPDNTFDVVTNAVSVDYLTRPLEVMREVQRVLKPVRGVARRDMPSWLRGCETARRSLADVRDCVRLLRAAQGGLALMSFSNRCFPTKAIAIWTSTGDLDHIWIVGAYFHYAGGFEAPQAVDISPNKGRSDPMYVVFARKSA
jgi:SAM-dependent methyltransferase